jgi:hypothetical protein
VRVDEVVDGCLVLFANAVELEAHAELVVAPSHVRFGFDVLLPAWQTKPQPCFGFAFQRTRRSNGNAAATQVQRESRGNRITEAIGDWNAEHDTRTTAPVEVVREEVRRQRRQDVLHRAVLVHVAGHAKCGELANFLSARNGAAEDEDWQPTVVHLADVAHHVQTGRMWQAQIDDEEIEGGEIGPDASQQFGRALDSHGSVTGSLNRSLEAIADKGRIIGDKDGFRCRHSFQQGAE